MFINKEIPKKNKFFSRKIDLLKDNIAIRELKIHDCEVVGTGGWKRIISMNIQVDTRNHELQLSVKLN